MKKEFYLLTAILLLSVNLSAQRAESTPLVDPVTQCSYRYFYYPNIEAYFDSKNNVYIFQEKGEWITADEIPSGYRGYSIYNKVNVVINDYDDDNPTQFLSAHKKKYPYNKGRSRELAATALK